MTPERFKALREGRIAVWTSREIHECLDEIQRLQTYETMLEAWHNVFGTTQLTHAKDAYDRALKDIDLCFRQTGEYGKIARGAEEERDHLRGALETLILKAKGKQGVLEIIGEEGDHGAAGNAKRFKREIEEAEAALSTTSREGEVHAD